MMIQLDPPLSYEFRCFVKDGKLIGITQYFRDHFFADLHTEIDDIKGRIQLFSQELTERYPVKDYVFDVFLDNNRTVILIEINPYGLSDPCLFGNYDELESENEFFRVLR